MVAIVCPPIARHSWRPQTAHRATYQDIPAHEPLASWPPLLASQPESIVSEPAINSNLVVVTQVTNSNLVFVTQVTNVVRSMSALVC
jgi:hypothetical protein